MVIQGGSVVAGRSGMGDRREGSDLFRGGDQRNGLPDLDELIQCRPDRGLPVHGGLARGDVISDFVASKTSTTSLPHWYHAAIIGLSTGVILLIVLFGLKIG
jgi:hypothetical protein